MGLTIALVLIALFIMLVADGLSPLKMEHLQVNPHAAIGLTCIILTLIQPLMAVFRPKPDSR